MDRVLMLWKNVGAAWATLLAHGKRVPSLFVNAGSAGESSGSST